MTQTNQQSPFGTLFPSTFLVAHHVLSGGVHQRSADECAALAATHLGGLEGKTTIHPGAGFGADIWAARMYDVAEAIGLEKSQEQKDMGDDIAFDAGERVSKTVAQCPVVQALYVGIKSRINAANNEMDIENRILEELNNALFGVVWARRLTTNSPLPIDIRLCDITRQADVEQALGQTRGDAVIANFVLHTLVSNERSTTEVLESLTPLVKPGGIIVVSLPSQVIEVTGTERNEKIRQYSVFNHPHFTERARRLQTALEKEYGSGAISTVWKDARLLIREDEVRAGSPSLVHVSSHLRRFMAPFNTERDATAGLLMFEAVFSARRPAAELAGLVRSVLLEELYDEDYGIGIHVQFHVLRRR